MAVHFVSASSMRLDRASSPLTTYPLTMCAWVRPTTVSATQTALSICLSGASANYHALAITSAAKILYEIESAGVAADCIGTTSIVATTWNHLLCTGLNATTRATFLNGTADGTNASSGTPTAPTTTNIGNLVSVATHASFFNGDIAEAAIWNVVLTQPEITMLSLGVCPLLVRPASLRMYAPLYGNATVEPDYANATGFTKTNTPTIIDHPKVLMPKNTLAIPSFATAAAPSVIPDLGMALTVT